MNEEMQDLQRRLEQATAPDCPAEALADPEVAAWREGWLSLARLLEKGAGPLCAQSRAPMGTTRSMVGWSDRSGKLNLSPLPRRRIPVLSALIAASLLIGVTWFGLDHAGPGYPEPAGGQNQVVQNQAPLVITDETDLRWDDGWDENMAALSTQITLLQNEGDGWTADYLHLRSRLDALRQEMDNYSL
jgi:hypothetical protein